MARKSLLRSMRSRWSAAAIWAMVPLAAISGRSVAGCLSPSGHFEQNCQCWASPEAGSTVCRCHCSKCAAVGVTCCCRNKGLAAHNDRAKNSGVQSGHCRAVGLYGVALAVSVSKVTHDNHQPADLAVVPTAEPCSIATIPNQFVAELNTGPPPNNLIVQLHHWII